MAPKSKMTPKWETPSTAVWTDNDECILKSLLAKREATLNAEFPGIEKPMTPYPKDLGPMAASSSGLAGGSMAMGVSNYVGEPMGAMTDGSKRRLPDADDGDWDQVTEKSWSAGLPEKGNEVEAIKYAAWQADVANVAGLDHFAQMPKEVSMKPSHLEVFPGVADEVLDSMAGSNLPDGLSFRKWGSTIIKFGKLEACRFSYAWVCARDEHASYSKWARAHLTDSWSSFQARDFGRYARCHQAIHVALTGDRAPGGAQIGGSSMKREFA